MDGIVLTDCFISIDGAEFSGKNTNVAISYSAAPVDVTSMGQDTKKNIGGVKDWSMSMDFIADEAVTGVFFDKVGTVVPVEVRATSAARSEANPAYAGSALVTEYTPLSGGHGDAHKVSMSVVASGPLQRLVAPSI